MKTSKPVLRRAALGVAASLLAAVSLTACGGDDSGSSSSSSSVAKPIAEIRAISGTSTAIKLDPGFLDALTTLKLTPAPLDDAKLDGDTITFPITGGNVTIFNKGEASPYVVGQIQHTNSGLSLTAGDKTVELRNFNVDPTISRVYGDVLLNGKSVVKSAYLFRLNGRTLQPIKIANPTVLTGSEVYISPDAASLLNDTFGTDKVTDQLKVGVATVTVDASNAS